MPSQVHPAHIYWAMPRRIRLDFETQESDVSQTCSMCGRTTTQLLTHYVTKNYGMNYKGAWNHPLSPYYLAKEERLPLHPQPGGLGYRHWLAWVLGMANDKKEQQAAAIVRYALNHRNNQLKGALRLWAFGYDMDNMKPRCWYESSLPLYGLTHIDPERQDEVAKLLENEVGMWLSTAELALSMLRGAIKDAWFGGEARGDYSHIDTAFWSATEVLFYENLRVFINKVAKEGFSDQRGQNEVSKLWWLTLRQIALDMFRNVFVTDGDTAAQNPARRKNAYDRLQQNLDGPKMLATAGVAKDDKISQEKTLNKLENSGNGAGMTNHFQANKHYSKALTEWFSGLKRDRGKRAVLKRAETILEISMSPAFRDIYQKLCAAGWLTTMNDVDCQQELAYAIGLLSHIEQHRPNVRITEAMSQSADSDKPAISPLRFKRLLESPDRASLFTGLRRVIPLLGEQPSLDITILVDDIMNWGDKVKTDWSYSYAWPRK